MNEKALANWTYSFDRTTTNVTIRQHKYVPIPLTTLFPFLKNLSVLKLGESIAQHYPHLTHFSIQSLYDDHRNPDLYQLIRLNPQLRYLHTSAPNNGEYLGYLSRMLPNLESIDMEINFCGQCVGPHTIHFGNVKKWSLQITGILPWDSYIYAMGDITFDQLETLRVDAADNYASEIIRLIVQYRHLKELEINMGLTVNEMRQLVRVTPSLKEFSFNVERYGMIDVVGALLLENHVIEKITAQSINNEVRVEALQEITPAAWELIENETPEDSYSFIRKEL